MRFTTAGALAMLSAWATVCPALAPAAATDPISDLRDIRTGDAMPDEGYCDQPYVAITRDGNWLATLTTGPGREGQKGQHIVATLSEDQGKTWSKPIDIEPSGSREASWVVPLVTPGGRVYAFYTYNGDDVHTLNGKGIRADTIGWYAYKFSDDGGRSWSERRWRLPMRLTACDRGNDWKGKVQIFWGIDKPMVVEGRVFFAFTRLGKFMLEQGEGWLYRSDNILTEPDPSKIKWELLPEGDRGIRAAAFGSVQEEHNMVALGDGKLYCVYRTTMGHPCHAYSDDGGRSWSEPQPMTYTPGGKIIKTPRACPMVWRTAGGRFLFWFHNNGNQSFQGRNPVWVSGGIEKNGRIHWSEPEILLYHPDPNERMSYPDLIEQDGRFWVSETNKTVARVHPVDPALLEGMWNQGRLSTVARRGLVLEAGPRELRADQVDMPQDLDLKKTGGLTIEAWIRLEDLSAGQVLLDSRAPDGRGIALLTTEAGALRIELGDEKTTASWDCDPGLLVAGKLHHVAAIADAGPRILSFVVDGVLCDGADARKFGWGRYEQELADVSGADKLRVGPSLKGEIRCLRVYARYLRTSEVVANFHAGP